jgi:wyosine [tRNA(Phe)-imidazoG37] synthetase (radical SAM superfamily)
MHDEVIEFAEKIGKACGYKIVDEQKESRVVLLAKEDNKEERIMRF